MRVAHQQRTALIEEARLIISFHNHLIDSLPIVQQDRCRPECRRADVRNCRVVCQETSSLLREWGIDQPPINPQQVSLLVEDKLLIKVRDPDHEVILGGKRRLAIIFTMQFGHNHEDEVAEGEESIVGGYVFIRKYAAQAVLPRGV